VKKGDIIEVFDPVTNALVSGRIDAVNQWMVAIIIQGWGNVAWPFRINLVHRIIKEL
jgi:hypothetical protein